MPKRVNLRAIKGARTYTILEAAEVLNVTQGTVRQWIRKGLRAMTSQRPCLILGSDLREFLSDAQAKRMVALKPDQLYCLSCRKPCRPYGMMVDYIPHNAHTGRLSGLCEDCDSQANRIIGRVSLPGFRKIFDVACRGGSER